MNKSEFLEKMKDILQTDEELKLDMELDSLTEWDSLSKLATVAFLDSDFEVKITFNDFRKIKTIDDLAKKAGI